MFLKHVNEKPPRIGKIVQDLPPKLDLLIHQLLEKNKDDRPRDAAWVGRMLEEIENDAFARKSAGLDIATARKVDRPQTADDAPITDEDREAARALKGNRKKKKKKVVPFFQRKWVQAAGIVSALVFMAGVVYFLAFRTASADTLYEAFQGAKTPEAKSKAAEAYLKQYGDQPGEQTEAAAREFRATKIRERERQLANRFANTKYRSDPEGDDETIYKDAMSAHQSEKDGRLADASALWAKVRELTFEKFPDDAKLTYTFDPDRLARARWVWIAEKRIKDIESVAGLGAQLAAKIDENRKYEKPIFFDPTSAEAMAMKAIRLERVKDYEKASKLWEAIIGLTEKDQSQHEWLLLASDRKARALEAEKTIAEPAGTARQKFISAQTDGITKRLDALLKDSTNPPAEWIALRSQCREIIDLYDDETEKAIVDDVARVKRVLAEAEKHK